MRTVQPLLLFHLLSCFEEAVEFPRQRAFISAAGLMVASLLSALFNQMYFYTAHKAGMRLQIAITGVIYRKASHMTDLLLLRGGGRWIRNHGVCE